MSDLDSFHSDELIKECIAITKAALNTDHPIQRKLLLYMLSEKQRDLAIALDVPIEDD